jgi:hypothetical protein
MSDHDGRFLTLRLAPGRPLAWRPLDKFKNDTVGVLKIQACRAVKRAVWLADRDGVTR